MILAERIFAALLAVLPTIPQPQRGRIAERRDAIVRAADEAHERYGVPPSVLLVVGMLETHVGTDDGEGGGWGAPISPRRRHVAGGPEHAARALATSYRVCGSWRGAIGRFRSGLCRPWQEAHRRYVERAMRWIERTHTHAGVPLPEGLGAVRLAVRR